MYVVLVTLTSRWFVWGHCATQEEATRVVSELVKQGFKATSVFLS